jgi:hypothetical protein
MRWWTRPGAKTTSLPKGAIEFENVRFHYGKEAA